MVFNSTTNTCECDSSLSTPYADSFSYDSSAGKCLPNCKNNSTLSGTKCVLSCSDNQYSDTDGTCNDCPVSSSATTMTTTRLRTKNPSDSVNHCEVATCSANYHKAYDDTSGKYECVEDTKDCVYYESLTKRNNGDHYDGTLPLYHTKVIEEKTLSECTTFQDKSSILSCGHNTDTNHSSHHSFNSYHTCCFDSTLVPMNAGSFELCCAATGEHVQHRNINGQDYVKCCLDNTNLHVNVEKNIMNCCPRDGGNKVYSLNDDGDCEFTCASGYDKVGDACEPLQSCPDKFVRDSTSVSTGGYYTFTAVPQSPLTDTSQCPVSEMLDGRSLDSWTPGRCVFVTATDRSPAKYYCCANSDTNVFISSTESGYMCQKTCDSIHNYTQPPTVTIENGTSYIIDKTSSSATIVKYSNDSDYGCPSDETAPTCRSAPSDFTLNRSVDSSTGDITCSYTQNTSTKTCYQDITGTLPNGVYYKEITVDDINPSCPDRSVESIPGCLNSYSTYTNTDNDTIHVCCESPGTDDDNGIDYTISFNTTNKTCERTDTNKDVTCHSQISNEKDDNDEYGTYHTFTVESNPTGTCSTGNKDPGCNPIIDTYDTNNYACCKTGNQLFTDVCGPSGCGGDHQINTTPEGVAPTCQCIPSWSPITPSPEVITGGTTYELTRPVSDCISRNENLPQEYENACAGNHESTDIGVQIHCCTNGAKPYNDSPGHYMCSGDIWTDKIKPLGIVGYDENATVYHQISVELQQSIEENESTTT